MPLSSTGSEGCYRASETQQKMKERRIAVQESTEAKRGQKEEATHSAERDFRDGMMDGPAHVARIN